RRAGRASSCGGGAWRSASSRPTSAPTRARRASRPSTRSSAPATPPSCSRTCPWPTAARPSSPSPTRPSPASVTPSTAASPRSSPSSSRVAILQAQLMQARAQIACGVQSTTSPVSHQWPDSTSSSIASLLRQQEVNSGSFATGGALLPELMGGD
uniref:LOB domain-containing protein n=1 Tax=Aegilops tauschii subsp. strangulata TaxID=200361 RepID=A0A453Q429_AEGTS